MGSHSGLPFLALHKGIFDSGLFADLPGAPEGPGDVYFAVDTKELYSTNEDGDAWVLIADGNALGAAAAKKTAKVYHSTTQGVNNGNLTVLAFDTEVWDNDSIHSNVTNNSRLTCVTPGKYHIVGNVRYTAGAATGRVELQILLNGNLVMQDGRPSIASVDNGIGIGTYLDLVATDYVQLRVSNSSGANITVEGGDEITAFMMVEV